MSDHPNDTKRPTSGEPTRRRFIRGMSAATMGVVAAPAILHGTYGEDAFASSSLFTLGVASGDPGPTSVVLWTRLAPDPLNGGGLDRRRVRVKWQVALDPGMSNVVKEGVTVALERNGHAVHVDVTGLYPDTVYYYRFRAMGERSRLGRTRTFPWPGDSPERAMRPFRFATVSCQNYQSGFYRAYREIGRRDVIEFVVHTGDYIYEGGPTSNPIAPGRVHNSAEIVSVEDYRNRYALYRLDEDLQFAHAQKPFICTWDDHEVDNNYAGLVPEDGQTPEEFATRRRGAYQVYAETMPLRPQNRTVDRNGNLNISRTFRWGSLADFHVLDTRQFRTNQPADDGFGSTDPASIPLEAVFMEQVFDADGIFDPDSQMFGSEQEAWLSKNLSRSTAQWNILAQQVMVTQWNLIGTSRLLVDALPLPPEQKDPLVAAAAATDNVFNVDAWDGYKAAQAKLQEILARFRPNNPVILTGDIHSSWAANILEDFDNPNSDMIAAEFVCTSISSTFGRENHIIVRAGLGENPHIEYFNGLYRGYALCDVNERRFKTIYRTVGTEADAINPDESALIPMPDSPMTRDAVVRIRAGFNQPGSDERLETRFLRTPPF